MDFSIQLNVIWMFMGIVLIFSMQAGFAMLEAGFTRAKNSGNIIMKNFLDFVCGSIVFWAIGYGLMMNQSGGVIGEIRLFPNFAGMIDEITGMPKWADLVFNTMFCATSATIVSGAMAGRTNFKAYLITSVFMSGIVYPISAGWVWGDGWLSTLTIGNATGFNDYAGSAVVHMVGGITALIGAKLLGPRIGKYGKKGESHAIPGHSITLGALGIFILWFGWFGFNASSSHGIATMENVMDVANVFMTTNTSAVFSMLTAVIITWVRYGKPDITMSLNGALAGLVAITAGCSVVDPWAAAITGIIAGLITVFGIEFIDTKLKIDDPVGASGVHGFCGLWGALACGFFNRDTGVFTSGEFGQLAIQLIGIVAILIWTVVTMTIVFSVIDKIVGLRVSEKAEIAGLDSSEHGFVSVSAEYGTTNIFEYLEEATDVKGDISIDRAIPVELDAASVMASDVPITKIEIITKQERFEALKNAMNEIGVTGMTVTNVMGCGIQKGSKEYYRSVPMEVTLLPKVRVEIVVAKVPVELVVNVAKKVLYTGHIGDGKIFIYQCTNAIKVRTGETGYAAMQGLNEVP